MLIAIKYLCGMCKNSQVGVEVVEMYKELSWRLRNFLSILSWAPWGIGSMSNFYIMWSIRITVNVFINYNFLVHLWANVV